MLLALCCVKPSVQVPRTWLSMKSSWKDFPSSLNVGIVVCRLCMATPSGRMTVTCGVPRQKASVTQSWAR